MKKFFKILIKSVTIFIVVIIALLILIPVLFKGKLLTKVQEEINKTVNAKVEFADFRLSFIKHFPNLSFALTELSVVGLEEFSEDTLVYFQSFSTAVDILSVFGDEGIQVKSILLKKPRLKAKVLENGKANWDIMKETTEEEEVPDTTSGEMPDFRVKLKKFAIEDARIVYEDLSSGMMASLDNFNFVLKGDMSMDYTDLDIFSTTESLNFVFDGIRYVKNASLYMKARIGADLAKMIFTFEDNEFALNELALGFDGEVSMPGDDIEVDLTFNTKKTGFKSLLSMVPAVYMKDFEGIQTDGSLSLNGYAKGTYSSSDSTLPNIGLELIVQNGMFSYPDLPKSVENVNIDTKVFVDGTDPDKTTVDVNRFYLELGGNPFDANLHIKTPMSDPEVAGGMNGKIDLFSLADVIPLEDMSIKGLIETNLEFGGKMSMYEKEQYEDFKADGNLSITGFEFISSDLPKDLLIPNANIAFSPQFVELSQFDLNLGKSDMHFTGRLENFIPFVFSDGIVKGNLNFSSSLLDITELIPETEEPETEETDTLELAVIEVPSNIDFTLTSKLDMIKYDQLEIKNTKGVILVKDGKVILDGLKMDLLEGSMIMSGEYNPQDMTKSGVSYNLDVTKIDIPSAFNAFNTIQKLVPAAKGLKGKVSAQLTYNSLLGSDMMPLIPTINGYGKLQSEQIQVVSSKTLDKISNALKLKDNVSNTFKDLNISFTIKDGRIYVEPFETKMGNIKMVVGGDQGIDQTLNYLVKMIVPRSDLGSGADQVVNDLVAKASTKGLSIQPGENINVDVRVGGTFKDPEIRLDLKKSAAGAAEQIKEQLKEKVTEEVEKKKEEVKEKIDEEKEKLRAEADKKAQKILEEAEVKAEEIKEVARKAAEAVKKEADDNAGKLEKEAETKGPLAQIAAKKTAEKLRKEGDKKAERIILEAEEKSQKLLDEAREKADLIKKEGK